MTREAHEKPLPCHVPAKEALLGTQLLCIHYSFNFTGKADACPTFPATFERAIGLNMPPQELYALERTPFSCYLCILLCVFSERQSDAADYECHCRSRQGKRPESRHAAGSRRRNRACIAVLPTPRGEMGGDGY